MTTILLCLLPLFMTFMLVLQLKVSMHVCVIVAVLLVLLKGHACVHGIRVLLMLRLMMSLLMETGLSECMISTANSRRMPHVLRLSSLSDQRV